MWQCIRIIWTLVPTTDALAQAGTYRIRLMADKTLEFAFLPDSSYDCYACSIVTSLASAVESHFYADFLP